MLTGSIIIYLLLTLAVGFWASRRIKSTDDYTLAGRSLPAIVVGKLGPDRGYRRPVHAAQFHDPIRKRQRRRKPSLARQPPHPLGRTWRRHAQSRTLRPKRIQARHQSIPQHGRPNGRPKPPPLRRFHRSPNERLDPQGRNRSKAEPLRSGTKALRCQSID